MASIYKANGEVVTLEPKNGKTFSLEELQQAVEGFIQIVYLNPNFVMIMDEEGKLNGKEVNERATEVALSYRAIFDGNFIVGDALVCSSTEIQ